MLTVAPVTRIPDGQGFKDDWSQPYHKVPLLDVSDDGLYWADLMQLQSIPSVWLTHEKRIACLSQVGVGLLNKRLVMFQTRLPKELNDLIAEMQQQWNEAFIWEVWCERFGTPVGFTNYIRTRTLHLPSGDVLASEIITGRPEVIIEDIRSISPSDAGVDPQSD